MMAYNLDVTGMCDNLGKAMAEMREAMSSIPKNE